MKLRYLSSIMLVLSAIFLASCGGGGGTDTVGVYDTVTLYASPKDVYGIISDIATSIDSDSDSLFGCKDTPPDVEPGSFDTIWITIKSEIIANLPAFIEPSKVRIDSVTITFDPMESSIPGVMSPALPSQFQLLPGSYVDPGGKYDIEVVVIPRSLKNSTTLWALLCTGIEYRYAATLKFDGVEVTTDIRKSVEAKIQVWIADYADTGT